MNGSVEQQSYPKRLIEVDLPIKKISEHARREKSIRHGHISTLHIWWARRPLAACRAVLCAALWPDPAEPICPQDFVIAATEQMNRFWNTLDASNYDLADPLELRRALLDFIAEFANWDNSTDERYLSTARTLTESAHVALGGEPGTRPLVVDPFAGGGAIPLEALRVGADAFASDLNPVAVLLNKVVLEYIPKFGKELADEVRKWGQWVKEEAEKELAEFYPKDPDGATPIAYLWARTITCENPACGAEVPLIGSFWLCRKRNPKYALTFEADKENRSFKLNISKNPNSVNEGLTSRNKAICPICGYVTPTKSVKSQLFRRNGGSNDAKLYSVITSKGRGQGNVYRIALPDDERVADKAREKLLNLNDSTLPGKKISLIPDELTPPQGALGYRFQPYGIRYWRNLYTPRQLLTMVTITKIVASNKIGNVPK